LSRFPRRVDRVLRYRSIGLANRGQYGGKNGEPEPSTMRSMGRQRWRWNSHETIRCFRFENGPPIASRGSVNGFEGPWGDTVASAIRVRVGAACID